MFTPVGLHLESPISFAYIFRKRPIAVFRVLFALNHILSKLRTSNIDYSAPCTVKWILVYLLRNNDGNENWEKVTWIQSKAIYNLSINSFEWKKYSEVNCYLYVYSAHKSIQQTQAVVALAAPMLELGKVRSFFNLTLYIKVIISLSEIWYDLTVYWFVWIWKWVLYRDLVFQTST